MFQRIASAGTFFFQYYISKISKNKRDRYFRIQIDEYYLFLR